jgi:hypothetical protein
VFHHPLRGRQPLILYATQSEFQQTNVVEGVAEGTGGVTEGLRRRIVLPTGGTLDDLNHVIGLRVQLPTGILMHGGSYLPPCIRPATIISLLIPTPIDMPRTQPGGSSS